jgi:cytochrome c-type biogenesis protein CcsB
MTAHPPSISRFLRFLGKVQFTTVLLLGGVVIMTIGTIVESRGSREIAWSAVYGTAWFDIFLFLIAVNLLIAVVNRFPIRRHQWPFVLTHFAIVILLAGAWISRSFGYEGRMLIVEGSEESRLFLDASEIRVRWNGEADAPSGGGIVETSFPLPQNGSFAGRILREAGEGQPGIRVAEYIPDGTISVELREGPAGGSPGIEFLVSAGEQSVRRWLIAGDPRFARADLGPVEVEFRRAGPGGLPKAAPAVSKPRIAFVLGPDDQLDFQFVGATGPGPTVPVAVGRTVSVSALGLDFRLERLLASARTEIGVEPSPAAGANGRAYVRLDARLNGTREAVWLERGGAWREVELGGSGKLEAVFGSQTRPLPFSVALEEFELIRYPGSSRPAEYRSEVRVESIAAGLPARDAVISMNRPLDVAGHRLFQSSYRLGESGNPDATVLTVSYDPGVPVVYTAFLLIILGIAWGLRGVRPKSEHAAQLLERSRSAPGAAHIEPLRATWGAGARAVRRAGAKGLGLLLAALAGLAIAPDAWAQPAVSTAAGEARLPVEETRGWAILADGRVKPLLSYAQESALAITGRESFDGLSALEILWGYVLNSREFRSRPYVRVDSLELKEELGLDASQRRFSFEALVNQRSFQEVVDRAIRRQQAEEELSRLEDGALEAYRKLDRVAGLMSGNALTIIPASDPSAAWMSPGQLQTASGHAHPAIAQGFGRLAAAYAAGDAESFSREARGLTEALRDAHPAVYPSESELARELFYEDFNAFGKAWKLYLVGSLLILLLGFSERPWAYRVGLALVVAGFVFQTIGIGTRWAIAGRAPVSDMYESLVFMGWGAIALGLVSEALYRKRFLALAAGLMGFICLAFAENLPIDSAINPLVPVLAHTYWLSVHVMTVMLSYSAFALAMVLGHVMIFFEVFRRDRPAPLAALSRLLYKTLQMGLLFLAAGIIFGAIWANESWGRYWGWDPKETWSLITFFVYLAIIHARFAGWLRHFGLAATAILGFLAVVMTYYGVNFILATGMHAYGFSEGGQLYVAVYAVTEVAIVVAAHLRLRAASGFSPLPVAGHDPTGA